MLLYHGSKNGIKGDIRPISRIACDFGQGFYLGDKEDQPKGLIAAYPNNKFYEIEYNSEGLIEKVFEDDYDSQNEETRLIQAQNTNRKNQLNNLIGQIQTKYRRAQNVKFFDEILEEWNK